MPISEQARTMRTAISPRLATNIFLNTRTLISSRLIILNLYARLYNVFHKLTLNFDLQTNRLYHARQYEINTRSM